MRKKGKTINKGKTLKNLQQAKADKSHNQYLGRSFKYPSKHLGVISGNLKGWYTVPKQESGKLAS